jgi:hypothetical protein
MPRMVVWTDVYVKLFSRGGVRGAMLALGESARPPMASAGGEAATDVVARNGRFSAVSHKT